MGCCCCSCSCCCGDGGLRSTGPQTGLRADPGQQRAFARRVRRYSFQETAVRSPSRARPQTANTASSGPKAASGDGPQGDQKREDHTVWEKQMAGCKKEGGRGGGMERKEERRGY